MIFTQLPTMQFRFEMVRSDRMRLWVAIDGTEGDPFDLDEQQFTALVELWERAAAIVRSGDARQPPSERGQREPLLTDPFALRSASPDDDDNE